MEEKKICLACKGSGKKADVAGVTESFIICDICNGTGKWISVWKRFETKGETIKSRATAEKAAVRNPGLTGLLFFVGYVWAALKDIPNQAERAANPQRFVPPKKTPTSFERGQEYEKLVTQFGAQQRAQSQCNWIKSGWPENQKPVHMPPWDGIAPVRRASMPRWICRHSKPCESLEKHKLKLQQNEQQEIEIINLPVHLNDAEVKVIQKLLDESDQKEIVFDYVLAKEFPEASA